MASLACPELVKSMEWVEKRGACGLARESGGTWAHNPIFRLPSPGLRPRLQETTPEATGLSFKTAGRLTNFNPPLTIASFFAQTTISGGCGNGLVAIVELIHLSLGHFSLD